jgi:hypothetical protein
MYTKKLIITIILLGYSLCAIAAATDPSVVRSIESREKGHHAVYLDVAIPDESCTYTDRAIIRESSTGGKSMLQVALSALTSNKKVIVVVEGCTSLFPDNPQHTAPQVIKIQIYNTGF